MGNKLEIKFELKFEQACRRNAGFVVLLTLLTFILLGGGCQKKQGTPRNTTQNTHEVRQISDANDPRWRNELFQSSVLAIRERATYENPVQYLNALNQVTDRFNSWIQAQPAFENWHTDPLVTEQIAILDQIETLREPIATTQQMLKGLEDNSPLPPDVKEQFQVVSDVIKAFLETVSKTEKTSSGMEILTSKLENERKYFLAQLVLGTVTPELKERAKALNHHVAQLGILSGSQRMEFLRATPSNMPTNAGESLVVAYENDVYTLFEQFLLQDISQWAQGKPLTELEEIRLDMRNLSDTVGARNKLQISVEDLERMTSIFNWTVANIDLKIDTIPRLPLEILFSGSGNVLERAWLCILLARQQDLNAFIIRVPTPSENIGYRFLIGFLHNDDIFLYDPELGMAVTKNVTDSVPLRWAEVCEEPTLLDAFWKRGLETSQPVATSQNGGDATSETRFVTAEALEKSEALIEASPWYMTQRFAVLQEALKNGKNRVVMSLSPLEVLEDGSISVESLDAALNAPSALKYRILQKNTFASVSVWNFPVDNVIESVFNDESSVMRSFMLWQLCQMFPDGNYNLWRGRMLYLQGVLTGPMSAAGYYQNARLSETALESNFAKHGPALMDQYRMYRCQASYALGLISYMLERPDAAMDSFTRHVLDTPFSTYHDGANYHCGKMCEIKGDYQAATTYYEAVKGPMRPQALAQKKNFTQEAE